MKLLANLQVNSPGKFLIKLPLINFLLAAVLGAVLRYYFISPIRNFNYKDWLQVHSHVMFLGWITLALFLLLLKRLPATHSGLMRSSIIIFEVSTLALFISFPLDGYGMASIFFLTLNMALAFVIFLYIFRQSAGERNTGWKFIKSGLIFMLISSLGPLALGPVSAMGMKNSVWHDFAIYFYLHFQYNGWFFMALIGLMLLEASAEWQEKHRRFLKIAWIILNISVILTFLLSVLGQGFTLILNLLGGIGALAQLIIVILFLVKRRGYNSEHNEDLKIENSILFKLSVLSLLIKLILQALSAIPVMATYAFSHRNIIIAYLHLAAIGFVSFNIISWYRKEGWIPGQGNLITVSILLLITGFLMNETVLLLSLSGRMLFVFPELLFAAALMMVGGITGLTVKNI